MLLKERNRLLKCPLLSSLHLRITQIASNSKTVLASIPIRPLIPWSEFSPTEEFIGFRLGLEREL